MVQRLVRTPDDRLLEGEIEAGKALGVLSAEGRNSARLARLAALVGVELIIAAHSSIDETASRIVLNSNCLVERSESTAPALAHAINWHERVMIDTDDLPVQQDEAADLDLPLATNGLPVVVQ